MDVVLPTVQRCAPPLRVSDGRTATGRQHIIGCVAFSTPTATRIEIDHDGDKSSSATAMRNFTGREIDRQRQSSGS
uniref:Uncharacterized protein n=1 Tax=Leersia perrieri TaxID=77586 RepID=A0A0D9XI64_9ORYZ